MDGAIGPCLPPHLQKIKDVENENDTRGTIGPSLPPGLRNTFEDNEKSELEQVHNIDSKQNSYESEENNTNCNSKAIGPALPPWLESKVQGVEETTKIESFGPSVEDTTKEESFGPSLPPGFNTRPVIGPAMPAENQLSMESFHDDKDIIGPMPPSGSSGTSASSVAEEFEKRSKKMKDRLTGNEEPKKLEREEWMIELPPLLQGFGGGPRKFRAREKNEIGNRSVWTETPADREKRLAEGRKIEDVPDDEKLNREVWAKRDAEIANKLADYNKDERSESLLSMHDKSRKRKKEEAIESGEASVRRPFDREIDLQTNRFDDAAKKRFIKKTQGLSSRFSSGNTTSKFL